MAKNGSTLTAEDIRLIWALRWEHGLTYRVIGEKFDISYRTAHAICQKETHSHVQRRLPKQVFMKSSE